MKVGDYIYYKDRDGNHWPGTIDGINPKTFKISINHIDGDKILNVKKKNLELQGDQK